MRALTMPVSRGEQESCEYRSQVVAISMRALEDQSSNHLYCSERGLSLGESHTGDSMGLRSSVNADSARNINRSSFMVTPITRGFGTRERYVQDFSDWEVRNGDVAGTKSERSYSGGSVSSNLGLPLLHLKVTSISTSESGVPS